MGIRRWARRLAAPVVVFVGGALPSVLAAAHHPGLIVDDWAYAAKAEFRLGPGLRAELHARPLQAAWHAGEFVLLGTHPVAHLLVLAALNGVAAILVWRLAIRHLPGRMAWFATAAWIALPNRGSTRIWASTAPNVLALILVLAAVLVAGRGRAGWPRVMMTLALAALAVLTYEGAGPMACAAAAFAVLRLPRHRRVGAGAVSAAALAATAGWSLAHTEKTGTTHPLRNASRLISIHFGPGILPGWLLWIQLLVLVAVVWSVAVIVLPGFAAGNEEKAILAGLCLLVLGAAAFVVTGFPATTDGLFDRGNLFADLGTALVLAGVLALLCRRPPTAIGMPLALIFLGVVAYGNKVDVDSYHAAVADGRRLLHAIDTLPVATRTRGPLTIATLPNRNGLTMFVEDYDLSAALALRYDTGVPYPHARVATSDREFTRSSPRSSFRLVGPRLVRQP